VSDFYVPHSLKEAPFYYDGISQDEYITEMHYYDDFLCNHNGSEYVPLRKQLKNGLIDKIPEEYKFFCLNPNWDNE
jgi:hypothetical protein